MMIQANANPRIFGTAQPLERVKVSYLGKSVETEADASGKWQVFLGKIAPKTSFELKIQGLNQIVIHDVLAGEVWLCAGQSNMIYTLVEATGGPTELASRTPPVVRLFTAAEQHTLQPTEVQGKWEIFDKRNSSSWSAVGYFFAKKLGARLNEPVGVIESGFGGSKIQPWVSAEFLRGLPAAMLSAGQPNTKMPILQPSTLYNGMINGLTRYTIFGIAWYQGESNVHEAAYYGDLLKLLIEDWRRRWETPDLPFLFVQLPNHNETIKAKNVGEWALLRDAQASALKLRDTAMIVTIDTTDGRMHSPNKEAVGTRLAAAALAIAYHVPVCYQGPTLVSVTRVGTVLVCKFKHTETQLKTTGSNFLSGFEVCGPDQKFYPAVAKIKDDTVVVAAKQVLNPTAVRYDWADDPNGNLINAQRYPAAPFRATPANALNGTPMLAQPAIASPKSAADLGLLKQRYRQEMLEKYERIQAQKHSVH